MSMCDWREIDERVVHQVHPAAFAGWIHQPSDAVLLLFWYFGPLAGKDWWTWELRDGPYRNEYAIVRRIEPPFDWAEREMERNQTRDVG